MPSDLSYCKRYCLIAPLVATSLFLKFSFNNLNFSLSKMILWIIFSASFISLRGLFLEVCQKIWHGMEVTVLLNWFRNLLKSWISSCCLIYLCVGVVSPWYLFDDLIILLVFSFIFFTKHWFYDLQIRCKILLWKLICEVIFFCKKCY